MSVHIIDPRQLKRVRSLVGLTQVELAKRAGLSQSIIAKIESGLVDPTFSTMKAISDAITSSAKVKSKKASDIASSPVIYVEARERIRDCIAIMRKNAISQLPIFSDDRLFGSISESHVLALLAEGDKHLLDEPVLKHAQPPFPLVDKDTPIEALLSLFKHVSAILVSSNGKITGIITKIDLLAAELS